MAKLDDSGKLIRTLRWRLQQAVKIAEAAETCSAEGYADRVQHLLEEVEDLVLNAHHLVQACLTLQRVDRDKSASGDEA